MRILFSTDNTQVSSVLNAANLALLGKLPGVSIDFNNTRYSDYDIVLFMGYDPKIAEARKAKPSLKIGIVDPRPPCLSSLIGADFLLVNGLETYDWFADHFEHRFIYYIYSLLPAPPPRTAGNERLTIGYHGNKVHLLNMKPHIADALDRLAEEQPLDFLAIYNLKELGPLPPDLFRSDRIRVESLQWSPEALSDRLARADIGLVPNLIPVPDGLCGREDLMTPAHAYNEHESDRLFRFKCTSNPGRILVFAQLGVPVVADLSPSACQWIRHGHNGFLAHSQSGWFAALKTLAKSAELRATLAQRLHEDFCRFAHPDVMNRGLVEFLKKIMERTF